MNKIFWGLVLAHVDVYAGDVDFLPDTLGYLLVLWGAWELRAAGRRFSGLAACAGGMAVLSVGLTGADMLGCLPDTGWPGAGVHLLDCALTAVTELVFLLAVRQAERLYHTEMDDALFLPAWLLTGLFAIAGAVLRVAENDIFAILTTGTTGLLTLWLLYAVWQIRRNYGYLRMQREFDAGRAR